jgi:hypothetical protein
LSFPVSTNQNNFTFEGGENMRKAFAAICLLLLLCTASGLQASKAETADYAGEWTCVFIDTGDGVKKTEYEGISVADLMKIQLNQDGTLQVIFSGETIHGSWKKSTGGIVTNIDGQEITFEYKEQQLVNDSDGMLMYLEKTKAKPGGLLSLVKGNKYAGTWAAAAVDEGDGILKEEMDGVKVADLLSLDIKRDGTVIFTSMGVETSGTWKEIEGGISIDSDSVVTDMLLVGGQLKAESDGAIVYFNRTGQTGGVTATPTAVQKKTFSFTGTWKAVRYETMGYTFDAGILFPNGCTITLNEDGSGEAFITGTYTEKITWQEKDGALFISGSYVFSSPVYDGEKSELTVFYGSNTMSVIFQKSEEELPAPTETLEIMPTPAPIEEVTTAPPEQPTPEPVSDSVQCKTALFTVLFPGDKWSSNDGWRTDTETNCAVKYELKDTSGSVTASVAITASSECVDNYRDKIKTLTDYAQKAGKESLVETAIGGIAFYGTGYESWGWNYIEYAARVPESRFTLTITIEQPENIGDGLQPILNSIAYKLPVLMPPNVDPPMPEDGTPYQPVTAAVTVGDTEITASWLKTGESIVLDSIFNSQAALSGGCLYILAGDKLYAFTLKDDGLTPDPVFENGVMQLDGEYEYLSAGNDGIVYVSEGVFNILAIKDGTILQDNSISGNLVMHPDGDWGISFWANSDPKLIRASGGVLTEEPWVLSNLSDEVNRQGRFSSINCVSISGERIYVAGTDAEKGDAQRVAAYDLNGKELFTFGAEDWTNDDAFGSVTGIVETARGILVMDGNNRALKLFSDKGKYLGTVNSDDLLGTDYPWLAAMIPTEDGVLVAAAQERADQSCDELLLYRIRGF